MNFYKTVTSGNDFIHINLQELRESGLAGQNPGNLALTLCARKTGIGADGLVLFTVGRESVEFRIFNQDGGEAEISGNGMAGLAAVLFSQKKFSDTLTLSTRAGIKSIELINQSSQHYQLKVQIGKPDFNEQEQFPFLHPQQSTYAQGDVTFHPVSVGNPHVVVLLEKPLGEDKMAAMALGLGNHPMFPNKTNVELLYNLLDTECMVYFHERGVGKTLSSSTGSAAVFAVLQKLGEIEDQLTIHTSQEAIRISGTSHIYVENLTKIMYKGVCLS